MPFPLNPFGQSVFRTSKSQSYHSKGERFFFFFPRESTLPDKCLPLALVDCSLEVHFTVLMKIHQVVCNFINSCWGCSFPFLEGKGRPLELCEKAVADKWLQSGSSFRGWQRWRHKELDVYDFCTTGWKELPTVFPWADLYCILVL